MFNYIIAVVLTLYIYAPCFAQERESDIILKNFKDYFNKHQTDSIYHQWGEEAKSTVPKAQLDTLLETQLYPLGDIQSYTFIKQDSALVHYKLNFDNTALRLILSIDSNKHVSTFLFQPYTEQAKKESASVGAQNVKNDTASTIDHLVDSLALKYISMPSTSSLAIGLIHNGRTNYYYYGETSQGDNTLPDKETLFEIGSISKTFTAALLANSVLLDSIKLDDPITKYLPDSVAQNEQLAGITFQNLATHTSGLPRLPSNLLPTEPLDPYKDYDRTALFSYLKNYEQHNKPDSLYEYSNLGYGIIGELLAYKYNSSYSELIEKTVCAPLQLENTTALPSGDQLQHFIPTYNNKGQLTPHWHFQALSGAGSLKATITDLLKYAESNLNIPRTPLGKALELTHKPSWLLSETQDLGLSWNINIEDFQEIFWHNGATFGSSSFLAFVPGKKTAVVILANAGQSVDDIGFSIIKALIQ